MSAGPPRPTGADPLVHLMSADEWDRALAAGEPLAPASLATQGFVHLSDARTLPVAAQRHFAGRHDLVALVLDPAALGSEVVWEEGDPPEGDLLFPHLRGPVPLAAVREVRPYRPGPGGRFGPLTPGA